MNDTGSRIVSFDLMPEDPDYYFVLTEALRDFAARQRAEAENVEDADDFGSCLRWAETAEAALDRIEKAVTASLDLVTSERQQIPGWEGSIGPGPGQYGKPHVYARDVGSGAGNCVCGAGLGDARHVQAAPGVPVPESMRY